MNGIIEYMVLGKPIIAFDLSERRCSALEAAHYIAPNDVTKFAPGIREPPVDEERQECLSQFAKDHFQPALA